MGKGLPGNAPKEMLKDEGGAERWSRKKMYFLGFLRTIGGYEKELLSQSESPKRAGSFSL